MKRENRNYLGTSWWPGQGRATKRCRVCVEVGSAGDPVYRNCRSLIEGVFFIIAQWNIVLLNCRRSRGVGTLPRRRMYQELTRKQWVYSVRFGGKCAMGQQSIAADDE